MESVAQTHRGRPRKYTTDDETHAANKVQIKKWREDHREELLLYAKKYNKEHHAQVYSSIGGECPTCNRTYANLYQHTQTKRHKAAINKINAPISE